MDLSQIVDDVADALVAIDSSGIPFKQFQKGVGPYGEPQLMRAIVERLAEIPVYRGKAMTRRRPDVLIAGHWALEFKLARPFGDNGKQAENWSVNLLHPYAGNVSVVGDCLKLERWEGTAQRSPIRKKILLGQGNQYRYILVGDIKKFPKAYIRQLLKEAHAFSLSKVKDKTQIRKGETITKSISAVKRTKGSKKKKK